MTEVENRIALTYLNIRQSIVILLAKLISIDFVMAFIIIAIYFVIISGGVSLGISFLNPYIFLAIFGVAGLVKLILSAYVILLWLNEYYEITPKNVVHRRGVIFRKTEMYDIDKIRVINVQDTFLGEIFKFATITIYDIRLKKYLDMYLIHNPQRYAHVLKDLKPDIEIKEDRVFLPFLPSKDLTKLE